MSNDIKFMKLRKYQKIEFSSTTILIEKGIGKGGFAEIYKGNDSNGKSYAVKVMDNWNELIRERIRKEIMIHRKASESEHVLNLIDTLELQKDHKTLILMDCCTTLIDEMNEVYSNIQMQFPQTKFVTSFSVFQVH